MGLQGSKPEDTKKGKGAADLTAIHKEYYPAFEECKKNPDFFVDHFTEVPNFAKNLKKYFPKANQNFESFFEMVMYLRREEKHFTIN